jgi:hypothetical protein
MSLEAVANRLGNRDLVQDENARSSEEMLRGSGQGGKSDATLEQH